MIKDKQRYYSNGKLLITGEYVVLDGAKSLAIPTKFGQSLTIETSGINLLNWKSYDLNNNLWFKATFQIKDSFSIIDTDNFDIANRLLSILNSIQKLRPDFLELCAGKLIETHLDFERKWGLGTSSTLINNVAAWSHTDPYLVLEKTFGGSGYDIACARHYTPITYQLSNHDRVVRTVNFDPEFKSNLYFVYLNQKKNSRDAIQEYKAKQPISSATISEVNDITENLISCHNLSEFQSLLKTHESIISKIIKQETIKEEFFNDFDGQLKSLGAWGGDFILVASEENPKEYFTGRGFTTIVPYSKMVLPN